MSKTEFEHAPNAVAEHYDGLDRFYRQLWGEHVHHGLWTESHFSPERAVRHLVRRVAKDAGLSEGDRVCDIGCGYGAPARLWSREYGAKVTGFTVSSAQHTYAREQSTAGPAPTYRLRDFLSNDLPDRQFDAVVAIESLTHIRRPASAIREAYRVLRPGRRFVACVWMADSTPRSWQQRLLLDPIVEEGRLAAVPTAETLRSWVRAAGFTVQRLDDVTPRVRRTWSIVLRRFIRALFTDPTIIRTLLDTSVPDRVFARTIPRIWLAQHLGVLRYGWLVAERGR